MERHVLPLAIFRARGYNIGMPHIFVYGSLKRGFKQHNRHMKSAQFVAATRTRNAAFEMLAVLDPDATDHYPSIKAGGAFHIAGEVYKISERDLEMLDEYEGPGYNRVTIPLENGMESFVYVFSKTDIPTTADHPRIRTEGDTKEWLVRP